MTAGISEKAMPLALGDSWKGYRIVGATRDYPEHYGAKLASGRLWEKSMEVVLGAEVAARIQEHLFSELKAPVLRVASKDVAVPFSRNLEQEFLYKASDIEAAIRQTLEPRKAR